MIRSTSLHIVVSYTMVATPSNIVSYIVDLVYPSYNLSHSPLCGYVHSVCT